MTNEEKIFEKIADQLVETEQGVERGPMMSAPGIKYKGKVFAFFYKGEMTFKLGKDFNPAANNITSFSYLSPFKNKAPMKAWFQIPVELSDRWEELSKLALEKMRKGK